MLVSFSKCIKCFSDFFSICQKYFLAILRLLSRNLYKPNGVIFKTPKGYFILLFSMFKRREIIVVQQTDKPNSLFYITNVSTKKSPKHWFYETRLELELDQIAIYTMKTSMTRNNVFLMRKTGKNAIAKLQDSIQGTFGVVVLIFNINVLLFRLLVRVLKTIVLHIRICHYSFRHYYLLHEQTFFLSGWCFRENKWRKNNKQVEWR